MSKRTLQRSLILMYLKMATLAMAMLAAENLLAGLAGQRPPNLVNPEVWGK